MYNPALKTLTSLGLVGYAFACAILVAVLSHTSVNPLSDVEELVTELTSETLLPDFASIKQTPERKKAFVEMLRPLVEAKNDAILKSREKLLAIQEKLARGEALSAVQTRNLAKLRERYHVSETTYPDATKAVEILLLRADVIPESMVLAQAALESGWGTSRFAEEAHNLFGQWCYTQGCGLIPERRASSAKHEVQLFANVEEAISAYYRNINSHNAYRELRKLRKELRDQGNPLTGSHLVSTLNKYSSRGEEYVRELKTVIRVNRFEQLTLSANQPDV